MTSITEPKTTSPARKSRRATARARNAQVVRDAGSPGHVLNPADVPRRGWRTDLVDPVLSFVVYGIPAGQGSKRPAGTRNGKPIMKEESEYVAPWRDAVREMARQAIRTKTKITKTPWVAIDAPVMISAVVTVPATKASTDRGDTYHQGTPDLDKMERAIGDALAPTPLKPSDGKGLTEAHRRKVRDEMMAKRRRTCVLHDDSRIVVWDHVTKVYPSTTVDSLGYPGVLIQVWLMSELDRANRKPVRHRDGQTQMLAADLAAWARPETGETWEDAARRLWRDDPDSIMNADDAPVVLRGRAISDDSMRTALHAVALHSPATPVVVVDEPVTRCSTS